MMRVYTGFIPLMEGKAKMKLSAGTISEQIWVELRLNEFKIDYLLGNHQVTVNGQIKTDKYLIVYFGDEIWVGSNLWCNGKCWIVGDDAKNENSEEEQQEIVEESSPVNEEPVIKSLPTKVAVELSSAAQTLNDMQSGLQQARNLDKMFAAEGRYEGELIQKYGGPVAFFRAREQAYAVFEKWECYANAKQIAVNWDLLKQQLNVPSDPHKIWLSKEGTSYANDLIS